MGGGGDEDAQTKEIADQDGMNVGGLAGDGVGGAWGDSGKPAGVHWDNKGVVGVREVVSIRQ